MRKDKMVKKIYICAGEVRVVDTNELVGTVVMLEAFEGLWSARGPDGRNHGDSYISLWAAAKQLQLGTGIGVSKVPSGFISDEAWSQ